MASFVTVQLPPSLPMKYIPYVPAAPKPKTTKYRAKAKPSVTEYNHHEDGSPVSVHGDGWADIDKFLDHLPVSDAAPSAALASATSHPGLVHPDGEGGLAAISPPQILQSHQPDRQAAGQAAGVGEMDLTVDGLFDGSSLEFPLVPEDDAAGASHSIRDIESGGGPQEYHDDDLDAVVRNRGCSVERQDRQMAAGMRALSAENTESLYNDALPEQDKPFHNDLSITSVTRKRKVPLSADAIISSADVLDLTPKPAPKDSYSAKRRRPAQPWAGSLVSSPLRTPKSTPPPACGGWISPLRTNNDPSVGNLDNGSKDNDADIQDLPRSDLLDLVHSGGEHHERGTEKELPESLRQSISPSRRTEGDRYANEEFYGGEDKSNSSDGEVGESDEDELNSDQGMSRRTGAAAFQRHKRSSCPFQDRRRGPSGTGLKHLGGNSRPARTLRCLKPSPSRRHSRPKADIATRSDSLRTSFPGTRAVYDSSINYGPSGGVDDQVTDISLCQVPKCTTLVTAIVRCNDRTSKPLTIVREVIGDAGQLIRMTQVTSESWLLVGCRYKSDDAPSLYRSRSSMQPRGDYVGCSPHVKEADHDAVDEDSDEDDDENDDFKNGGEGLGSESSGGCNSDAGADDNNDDGDGDNNEHRRVQVRTRKPWLESDDQRLLACKNQMGMKWNDIFPLFSDRTAGAVRARWYVLQGK
ncbi:hypothetical protein K432DRAFT_394768 [Lepidopterella palustris CBS 459.81]|uniref:Myb-like domain-containing protein n=1 Tax=Lepidopterella palustris CBS 459.81 TaxID=1314670 RepID=A0A8E2E792_9PEZI|nr:hypothetical protein K432DRAFT_394768 [Lepidopterella palustris CBS 459.81]